MTDTTTFQPLLITGPIDLATALYGRRAAASLTAEQVDDIAGFQERYTAKLERPECTWGRGSLSCHVPSDSWSAGRVALSAMGAIWLQALGLRLVLMTDSDAERLGAAPTPPPPSTADRHARASVSRAIRTARTR